MLPPKSDTPEDRAAQLRRPLAALSEADLAARIEHAEREREIAERAADDWRDWADTLRDERDRRAGDYRAFRVELDEADE